MSKEKYGAKECIEAIKANGVYNPNIQKYFDELEEILTEYEAIKNSNPSEALECVDILKEDGCITTLAQGKALETIRQALLKAQEQEIRKLSGSKYHNIIVDEAQEPKHYLKWEDLEFNAPTSLPTTIKVKMGDTQYRLCLRTSFSDYKSVVFRDTDLKPILHIYEKEKQLFNDLHLERVEE